MGLYILTKFRKLILDIDFLPFIVSVILLFLSIAFDKTFQEIFLNNYINIQLYEEGFKFVGIICWMNFWWKASLKSLR